MLLGSSQQRPLTLIVVSLALAGSLAILPLGWLGGYFQPDWVALVLIYWCIWEPERIGAGAGWCAGLMLDLLTGGILGRFALGMTVVGFLANKVSLRLRAFPLWQQCIGVAVLVSVDVLCHALVGAVLEEESLGLGRWLSPLASLLAWPLVVVVLAPRSRQRRYR